MSLYKKIIKKLKSGIWYPFYNTFYEKVKINPNEILLQSRNGIALESNILAICRELNKPEYSHFKKVMAIQKSQRSNIEQKLKTYGLSVDKFVYMRNPSYYYHLSRAAYLINDVTFPGRYIKKEGQTYLNVWHGTPLKRMGQDNEKERYSAGNIIRNFLMSDYIVFPNLYMEEKMSAAFNLKELYQGTVLHEGYPRNCIFFDKKQAEQMKKKLGFENVQLSVYMPTFRGKTDNVEKDTYTTQVNDYLTRLDNQLNENQIVLVKLHPLVQKFLSTDSYKHIRSFPTEYDTYDVLNACDVLITDYSSVMYDFANTGKKIILFAYDIEEYNGQRGMYEDITTYPFDLAKTPEEVAKRLCTSSGTADDAFIKKYETFENPNATERICRHVILGENLCQTYHMPGCSKRKVLIYAGSLLPNGITTAFRNLMKNLDKTKYQYYVSFRMPSLKDEPERLAAIPEGVSYFPLATEMNLDVLTAIAQLLYLKYGTTAFGIGKRLEKAYDREWRKHFYGAEFDHIVHYDGYENYMIALLQKAPCTKTIWVHNDMEQEMAVRKNPSRPLLQSAYAAFDHVIPVGDDLFAPTSRISGKTENIQVISNYIDCERVLTMAEQPLSYDPTTEATISCEKLTEVLKNSDKKIITIGRYSPEKSHDRLIRSFDRFWKSHPDTWLIIIGGRGELYEQTCSLAKEMPSKDHIILLKAMSNPMPVLKSCNLFMLSSFYEGMPLVLLEAATLGIPAAACKVNGTRTFMNKFGGVLLENSEDGIYKGMEMFMNGKIPPMGIDFKMLNQKTLQDCEELFAK